MNNYRVRNICYALIFCMHYCSNANNKTNIKEGYNFEQNLFG